MMEETKSIITQCFHCGEDCRDEMISKDDKHFCCVGCQTVFDILHSNGLSDYYRVEFSPGASQQSSKPSITWKFLDQPEVIKSLVDFQEGRVSRATLFVPAIHCSACIWLLANLSKLRDGVLQSSVHFLKKEVSITFDNQQITLRQLAELLQSIGYVPEITLGTGKERKSKSSRNTLAIQIGVSGFCFGNIMLLSLPDYLDNQSLDSLYRGLFSYLSLILVLPVVFISATSYFVSAFRGIRHNLLTIDVPIALGISVLFGRSAYEIVTQNGSGYLDSLAGLVFFLLIGKWFQNRTYQALSYDRDYASYFPISVTKLVNQEEHDTLLKDLKVGDHLLIRNQEIIPADAILITGEAAIDYSFVSGESNTIHKKSGDLLFAGGRQLGGPLVVKLCKEVEHSYLTDLWNQDIFTKPTDSKLHPVIDRVGKYFTWVILLLSFLTAIFWLIVDPSMIPDTVTSVLIVACPCALALSVPFASGHAMRILGKWGLYVKNTETVEKLAMIDHIVFDKTGTITQQQGKTNQHQRLRFIGKPLTNHQRVIVQSVVRNSTHPLSKAIYYSLKDGSALLMLSSFEEQTGQGLSATVEGVYVLIGSEKWVKNQPNIHSLNSESAVESNKFSTKVYVALNGKIYGYYSFDLYYRPGISNLLEELQNDYTTHLLSGDQDHERNALSPYFQNLLFDQSPIDKLNYIEKLEKSGHHTLMVGDGLNDAGALKQSHVGIAIADDIYHFSPACDAILSSGQLNDLGVFLHFSKYTMRVVRQAFGLSFLYNIVGLSFAVSGWLTPLVAAILMPLSSITVVGYITLAINRVGKKLGGRKQ